VETNTDLHLSFCSLPFKAPLQGLTCMLGIITRGTSLRGARVGYCKRSQCTLQSVANHNCLQLCYGTTCAAVHVQLVRDGGEEAHPALSPTAASSCVADSFCTSAAVTQPRDSRTWPSLPPKLRILFSGRSAMSVATADTEITADVQ
jgi:hypothetical protein